MQSVQAVRDVSQQEAEAAVERVFERCVQDWDPIGRIPRTCSQNEWKAISKEMLPDFQEPPKLHEKLLNFGKNL